MFNPNFIMLYVDSPTISAEFYATLLAKKPSESSPTFAMFLLDNGYKLGLWSRESIEPPVNATAGSGELGFLVSHMMDVDATYVAWQKQGLRIAQVPTQMDFGYTFVALDPDGYRLRVYSTLES